MIIAVANIKGGVGKTTISINLAIQKVLQKKIVLLVDADEQGTASTFTEVRSQRNEDIGYTMVRLKGAEVFRGSKKLAQNYDFTIIDVGGRETASLRGALSVCNKLIIPLQPRSFDLWALEQTIHLIEEAKPYNPDIKSFIVVNAADPQGKDNQDTIEALSDYKDKIDVIIDQPIIRRKIFSNSSSMGLSIFEHQPADLKALQEFTHLINVLEQTI